MIGDAMVTVLNCIPRVRDPCPKVYKDRIENEAFLELILHYDIPLAADCEVRRVYF